MPRFYKTICASHRRFPRGTWSRIVSRTGWKVESLAYLLDPSEYMEDCTVEMERDAICATIQAVIYQGEDVTPWVAAVSASAGIVHAERAVTDLVFRQLTLEEIQRAQRGDRDISRILAYKKRGYPTSVEERKNETRTTSC